MVCLLYRGDRLVRYTSLALADTGAFMSANFVTQGTSMLSAGDNISIKDEFASHEFVVKRVAGNLNFCINKVLADLRNIIFRKPYNSDVKLSTILSEVGRGVFKIVDDISVLNFGFIGDGVDLIVFLNLHYGLKSFIDGGKVVFYRDTNRLNSSNHHVVLRRHNVTFTNLGIRAFDYVNGKQAKYVLHLPHMSASKIKF